ncbi:MAG: hypothetical protein D6704_09020 [Nitrospirae bacterium]|nr:MAG: hypothetical protein D6704_09020 [Nitrospirota bacterium]
MFIRLIAPESLHLGFASAGVECIPVETAQDAWPVIAESIAQPDLAILLIATTIAEPWRAELEQVQASRAFPLILEIPDLAHEPPRGADILSSLMTRFGLKV